MLNFILGEDDEGSHLRFSQINNTGVMIKRDVVNYKKYYLPMMQREDQEGSFFELKALSELYGRDFEVYSTDNGIVPKLIYCC
jgi:hypothetical protein